jgi:hypothetical protein
LTAKSLLAQIRAGHAHAMYPFAGFAAPLVLYPFRYFERGR